MDILDVGLQHEHTILAWDRTGLALMIAGGTLERVLSGFVAHPVSVVSVAIFALGLATLLLTRYQYLVRWQRIERGDGILKPWPLLTVAIATVVLGVVAAIVVAHRTLA